MRIKELNITEFGCFKDKKIEFSADDNALDIIYGENESGKSTVMLFIKFMLYGLGRKSASNYERERSLSWSGHTATGSMSFVYKDKEYRIERRFNGAVRNGTEHISFVCLDDGEEIKPESSIGEYLFGVPREVFESSAFVGQLAAQNINGEKTSASIQNLMNTADESVDTAKIIKSLDGIRVTYRYKSKAGGSLYDEEQRISALKRELEGARDATVMLDEQTQKLESARTELEHTKRELEVKEELVGEINKINILRRFARFHRAEADKKEVERKTDEHIKTGLKTDFFPTRSHNAELKLYSKALDNAQRFLGEKQAEAEAAKKQTYDAELAALGEQIEADGGVEEIVLKLYNRENAIRSAKKLSVGFWTLGAVGTLAGIVFLILGIYVGVVAFSALIIPIAALISGMTRTKKVRCERDEILSRYGAVDNVTLDARFEAARGALENKKAYEELCRRTEAELSEAEKQVAGAREMLGELLKKTVPELDVSVDNAQSEYTRLEGFISAYEQLRRENDRLVHFIDSENSVLCDYNEQELSDSISIDTSLVTPAFEAEAARQRSFFSKKKEVLEQKIFALGDSVANLRANAKDPLEISDRLAESEAEYHKDSEFYDALTLAMESIEKAGQVMSGSVMPAIAARAGQILGEISKEKYTVLRATSNLTLSLEGDGFGIKSDYLSGGTRDAAYLALRLALFMKIFGEELPPLMLDEALCQIDDTRARRVLKMLSGIAESGVQCLLFTSHKREEKICNDENITVRITEMQS